MALQPLTVTVACGRYDRVQDLFEGRVDTDGLVLRPVHPSGGAPEIFFRSTRYAEFDVTEMSFSSYLTSLDTVERPFVAIPVFLSRAFRHGNIFVSERSGIRHADELRGKRVGVSEYGTSASVWIRGMLNDEYAVQPRDMQWFSRREEKLEADRGGVVINSLPGGSLDAALVSGEIDAVIGSMRIRGEGVRRLFEDHRTVEAEYYRRTRIFPIMHVLAIRRDLYEAQPWIARTLYKAFAEARLLCLDRMAKTSVSPYMLPWVTDYLEEQRQALGEDIWSYGLDANVATVEAFARYAHEQGLTSRRIGVEDMFVPYRHTNNDPRFDR